MPTHGKGGAYIGSAVLHLSISSSVIGTHTASTPRHSPLMHSPLHYTYDMPISTHNLPTCTHQYSLCSPLALSLSRSFLAFSYVFVFVFVFVIVVVRLPFLCCGDTGWAITASLRSDADVPQGCKGTNASNRIIILLLENSVC